MHFTIAFSVTILSALSIVPIANAQPSPQASCFECPPADDGLNILLSSTLPDPTTGEFSCAYAGGGTCVYLGLQGQVSYTLSLPIFLLNAYDMLV